MTALIVPVDDYSPIRVGDTGNTLSIQAIHKNGSVDISSAVLSLKLRNVATGAIKTCTGPWTPNPTENWKSSYAFQASDVNTAGDWEIWIDAEIAGKPLHLDDGAGNPKVLQILALPSGI